MNENVKEAKYPTEDMWAEANERFFNATEGKVGIPKELFYSNAHVSKKGSMQIEVRL